MAGITFKNIVKQFDDNLVIKNANLTIEDGEFIVLVGPSGCGKSTLLRMVAGLEHPTSGDVFIGETNVTNLEPQNRNIAMVFQNYALYPHKSVKENIIFGLKRTKLPEAEIDEKLQEVSEMLQLEDYLERKPAELSGGQRQRVAMGRAIARPAAAFLFDEPLSNLDAKLRGHMRTEIKKIHSKLKMTSVYVTHDQVEAMTLGDRVVVVKDGIIEQVGSPMKLYLDPDNVFVATFIGSPAMNIFSATMEENHIQLGDFALPLDKIRLRNGEGSVGKGRQVKLGIRPDFFNDANYTSESGKEQMFRFDKLPVDIVEPLGYDQEVISYFGNQMFKARLDFRTEFKDSKTVDLCVDINNVLVFDAETDQRL